MINFEALFKISYGLYIVCSGDKIKGNGFISNTVFQVSAEPAKFAVCCNKDNYTTELIQKHQAYSVSIISQETPPDIFGTFGFKSGSKINKMTGLKIKYGESGVPIVLNAGIAYLECRVTQTVDVGTHLMFIGDLINADFIDEFKEPMTYLYYRQVKKGVAPKNSPTYLDKSRLEKKLQDLPLKKYKCPACGFIYDELTEPVKFNVLPDAWVCPACGTEKSDFMEILT